LKHIETTNQVYQDPHINGGQSAPLLLVNTPVAGTEIPWTVEKRVSHGPPGSGFRPRFWPPVRWQKAPTAPTS